MRFDSLCEFGPITLSGTTVSSNVIDTAGAGIAEGPMYVVAYPTAKVTQATKLSLQTSDDDSTYTEVATCSFAANDDVGAQAVMVIPPGCGRYLKIVATGTNMSGTVQAGITLAVQSAKGIEQYAAN